MITDPRRLAMPYPRIEDLGGASAYDGLIEAPLPPGDQWNVRVTRRMALE